MEQDLRDEAISALLFHATKGPTFCPNHARLLNVITVCTFSAVSVHMPEMLWLEGTSCLEENALSDRKACGNE